MSHAVTAYVGGNSSNAARNAAGERHGGDCEEAPTTEPIERAMYKAAVHRPKVTRRDPMCIMVTGVGDMRSRYTRNRS